MLPNRVGESGENLRRYTIWKLLQSETTLLDTRYKIRVVAVDILSGGSQTPEFLAKNPNRKIPLLELDDGRCLAESNAIVNYLAAGSDLLPTDTHAFAKVQEWQFFEQYSHEPYIAVARFIAKYLGLSEDRRADYESSRPVATKLWRVWSSSSRQRPTWRVDR